MPSGTGSMGTGSDVRIYSPRSESSTMFRNNDGDDSYNPSDPRFVDAEVERKQKQKEAEDKKRGQLKHIKVKVGNKKTGQTGFSPQSPGIDDSEKIDADREIHAQTGPAGNQGYLTSLATQAKGPGTTRGEMVAMGEPMKVGVLLLKKDNHPPGFVRVEHPKKKKKSKKQKKVDIEHRRKWRPSTGAFKKPPGGMSGGVGSTIRRYKARMRGIKSGKKTGLMEAPLAVEMSHRGVKTKQPMSKEPRRYRQYLGAQEARQRLGNVRTVASAPPRFGTRSYTAGPTGAGTLQALLPGVSQIANPVGVRKPGVGIGNLRPRLAPHRAPPMVPSPGLSKPALVKPSAPSMPPAVGSQMPTPSVGNMPQMRQDPMTTPLPSSTVQMSEDRVEGSDILKRSPFGYSEMTELRQLIHAAKRALRRKERQRKGKGDKDTSGGGSNLPKHPANGPKQTNRNEGATEDAKTDPRTFGLDPISHITGKGGRTP